MQRISRRQLAKICGLSVAGGVLYGAKHVLATASDSPAKGVRRRLRAGVAVVDITPLPDVPLRGPVGGSGLADVVHDRLNARALVLDNEIERIAIVVCDVCMVSGAICDAAKKLIQCRTKIPGDQVLISATHTHRAPRCMDLGLGQAHERYMKRLAELIPEVVDKAAGSMAEARVGWGAGKCPEFCRNRRWIMKPGTVGPNPFGERGDKVKMCRGPGEDTVVEAGLVDPALSVLSVQRVDGRPLALLANYSVHYGEGGPGVSADYFGHFAQLVEKALDGAVGIMTNGTSGDIAPGGDPVELANSLTEEAIRIHSQIEHRRWVPIIMEENRLKLSVRGPNADRIEWARQVQAGNWGGHEHPWTKRYAEGILRMAEWSKVRWVKLQAMRIGELGIAAMPTETYAETGLAIKQNSVLKPTFIVTLANGYCGYLPTPQQHELGGYTTWLAPSSFLEIDAEQKLRAEVLRLLYKVATRQCKV
jgi:hypothetical protein